MATQTASEKEMTAMAEEELARLQRQLRIMEDDRIAYAEETKSKLEKQRRIIKILKEEKNKIQEDLDVATCKNHIKRDKKYSQQVEKLLNNYEKICKEIEKYKNEIREISVQHKKVESEIKELQAQHLMTEQEYQYRIKSGNNAIKVLENRLENSIRKFCKIIVENKKFREEIDHLLIERCQFNKTCDDLLQRLKNGKKTMVELIDQATLAYDHREESSSKLEALKKRTEQDLVLHTEEMREIKRRLDHDNRLQEFLCTKGQKRILRDLEEKERLKHEAEQRELENQLKTYEETLSQIKEYCDGEEDVERIASQFAKQEEENFALFNYVNELNHDIEELTKKNGALEVEISEQIKLSEERTKTRNHTLETLQDDYDNEKIKSDDVQNDLFKTEEKVYLVLQGILKIFNLLKCEKGSILELLADDKINFDNVMIYMGTIEKKISDIINSVYHLSKGLK